MWLIIRMIEAISAAAVTHRILLSLLTLTGNRYLSALNIAAWCRQIADVCMHMFAKTTFGSVIPEGKRIWSGRPSEVCSSICSMLLCRFQKPPLMSSSRSSGPGRCRWSRLRPNMAEVRTMAPKACIPAAPPGFRACSKDPVGIGLLFSKASSLAGRFVVIWNVSTLHQHGVGRVLHLVHRLSLAIQYRCWHTDQRRTPSRTSSFALPARSSPLVAVDIA